MAIDRNTVELLDGLHLSIGTYLEAVDSAVLASWSRAWNEVAVEWDAALADLVDSSTDGQWPSRRQIARADRAQRALQVTRDRLDALALQLRLTVTQDLRVMLDDALSWHARILASQLPPNAVRTAELVAGFNRVDPLSLDAIVRRTTTRVTALSSPLPAYVQTGIQAELVRGIAIGDNPRQSARRMLDRVGGIMDGGRTRALVIARTEMLDAHRAAARDADRANRSVVAKWEWVTTLDARTCIGCLVMHGRAFPVTEDGPAGHQQCRCARVPKSKSWADLGFDIEEPPDLLPDAKAWFDGLPENTQAGIAGRARLLLYQNGMVGWDDLVTKRNNRGWRDSYVPTPVRLLT